MQGRTGEAVPGTEEGGNSQNHLGIYGRGKGGRVEGTRGQLDDGFQKVFIINHSSTLILEVKA